jgi:hypothetical protein
MHVWWYEEVNLYRTDQGWIELRIPFFILWVAA